MSAYLKLLTFRQKSTIDRVAWVVALLLAFFLIGRWTFAGVPGDYYQIWAVGQAIKTMPNLENVYDPEEKVALNEEFKRRAKQIPIGEGRYTAEITTIMVTGTPLHYLVAWLPTSGVFRADHLEYRAFCAAVYALSIVALAWTLGFSGLGAIALMLVLTYGFFPFKMGINITNLSVGHAGLFGLTVATLLWRGPGARLAAGFLLAVLILIKPTLTAVPPLLLLNMLAEDRWRDAGYFVLGAALGTVAGLMAPIVLLGPSATWMEWWRHLGDELFTDWWLTGGFLGKLIGEKNPRVYTTFGLILTAAAGWAIFRTAHKLDTWRSRHWPREESVAALGALIYLLSGPIVHSHYFVKAVPAVLYAFRPAPLLSPHPWGRWILGSIALYLMAAHHTFKALGWTNWPNHSLITYAGVWILVGIILHDWFAGGPKRAANLAQNSNPSTERANGGQN